MAIGGELQHCFSICILFEHHGWLTHFADKPFTTLLWELNSRQMYQCSHALSSSSSHPTLYKQSPFSNMQVKSIPTARCYHHHASLHSVGSLPIVALYTKARKFKSGLIKPEYIFPYAYWLSNMRVPPTPKFGLMEYFYKQFLIDIFPKLCLVFFAPLSSWHSFIKYILMFCNELWGFSWACVFIVITWYFNCTNVKIGC